MPVEKERKIITDKLVKEKTKHTIEEWFVQLDKKGAAEMSHQEIFSLIGSIKKLQPLEEWSHNLLATSYEWSRGIKQRGEKANGFEISVSKTIDVPVDTLYAAWIDDKLRTKWLKEKIIFRKTTLNKSARVTWSDSITSLSIDFYVKGENKSQVVVQHLKLPGAKKANDMKLFWGVALSSLKLLLEK